MRDCYIHCQQVVFTVDILVSYWTAVSLTVAGYYFHRGQLLVSQWADIISLWTATVTVDSYSSYCGHILVSRSTSSSLTVDSY